MADIFQLLADPTRRELIELTSKKERKVTELVKITGITQPGVSKQLRLLREGGLLKVRVKGRYRFYQPKKGAFNEVMDWLLRQDLFWNEQLNSLEKYLDEM